MDYTNRVAQIGFATRRPSEAEFAKMLVGIACVAGTASRSLHKPLCRFVRGRGAKMYVEKLATNIAIAYMLQDRYGISTREFDAEFFLSESYGMEFSEEGSMTLHQIRRMFAAREFSKRIRYPEAPYIIYYDSRDHPETVRQWVFEHLGERAWWPPCGMRWSFLRAEDAVAFRLRWSGEQGDVA